MVEKLEDLIEGSMSSQEALDKIHEEEGLEDLRPLLLELISDGTPQGTFLRDQDKRAVPNVSEFAFGLDAQGRQVVTVSFFALPTEINFRPKLLSSLPGDLRTIDELIAEHEAIALQLHRERLNRLAQEEAQANEVDRKDVTVIVPLATPYKDLGEVTSE